MVEFPTDMGVEEKGYEPEMILLSRWGWQGETRGLTLLVKWRGMSEEEATWMSETDFRAQFPYFNLRYKAVAKEGSNVENTMGGPTLKVYTRRSNPKGE